jgi:hypothetical protein
METVIGLFKTECIGTTLFHQGPYKALADVEYATAGWIETSSTGPLVQPAPTPRGAWHGPAR